ncbi:MAG: IS110 family transposase [Bacteroidales bacterium]
MQLSKLDFSGQNIYAGIDVHKKSWSVHLISETLDLGSFSQPPDPQKLSASLKKRFPGATFFSVYEAGFCGFWIHRALEKEGISNIVVNAADIPTTNKEKTQKRDKVDCKKLAKALRSSLLTPIYIPSQALTEERMLVRTRYKLIRDRARCKNRIKALLNYNGISIPQELGNGHWTARLLEWMRSITMEHGSGQIALNLYLSELDALEKLVKETTDQIKKLSRTESYRKNVRLLCTIPGIGIIVAMTILTELGDISRFHSLDRLASYIGLVPDVHASGESEKVGRMTHRGNDILKCQILESAWMAVRKDPALLQCYQDLIKRMKPTKAIIRIARKLISRLRYVLIHQQPYELGVVG